MGEDVRTWEPDAMTACDDRDVAEVAARDGLPEFEGEEQWLEMAEVA